MKIAVRKLLLLLSACATAGGAFASGPWESSQWITAGAGQGTARPAMRLTREFSVTGELARAVLHATALGIYVPYVNGREITARRMLPGWTQYDRRVVSQEFDVTAYLNAGTNTVSALVGDGWYSGQISYVATGEAGWGTKPRFRAELSLEYRNGRRETIGTDGSWTSFYLYPATLANDIYQGEEYDATIDDEQWKKPGCRRLDSASGVQTVSEKCAIAGDEGQPVLVDRVLKPIKIERRPSGTIMLDFGENIAGVDRITLAKAHPGAVIVIRHGEDLDADGNLWRKNLAFAGQKTVLTCGFRAPFVYSPRFTFYGYRYAEVSGWPADEEFTAESVQAEVLTSAVRQTGEFSSSNPLLNRLFANVLRSQQGNFIDVPTDCPQRCERFGWTGDAQIFAETAMMNYDVERFFAKWMGDVRLGCNGAGAFPMIAPWPGNGDAKSSGTGMAGWSDAGVVVPWMLYRKYANGDALAAAYPSMAKYAEAIAADGKLATIGDHLNLNQPTSGKFVSEALRIEMLRLVALAARALGNGEDEARWRNVRDRCIGEFRATHCGANGLPRERTQTAMAMAIVYGICADDAQRRLAGVELVALLRERGGHLATGFLGTPILLRALTESGNLDEAYRLLETESAPGWLYPVTQGATTIWERWDAKVDGRYHANWMNSMNHYAYGSVVGWFYDTILGIRDLTEQDVASPGFAKVSIAPQIGGSLKWAKGAFVSRHGRIACSWRRGGNTVEVEISVPDGIEAEFEFPGTEVSEAPGGVRQTGKQRWTISCGGVYRWKGAP